MLCWHVEVKQEEGVICTNTYQSVLLSLGFSMFHIALYTYSYTQLACNYGIGVRYYPFWASYSM